jgi:hypothetical protein
VILICANTMHLNFDQVAAAVAAPVIHIADASAQALKALGVRRPLLLATRFTMEKAFYRDRLAAHGIEAMIPDKADRDRLHAIIFEELVLGDIRPSSKAATLAMYSAATGSVEYKTAAREAMTLALYAVDEDGCPRDTLLHSVRGGWQEDAHSDKIHNVIDALRAFPEWAR